MAQPHLSVSQLNEYLSCSWKYYLKRVLGWKERPKLILANGKAGHQAVEFNQRHMINKGQPVQLDVLLDLFSDSYDSQTYELEPSDLDPDENIGRTKDNTAEILKVYHAIDAPKHRPVATEVEFELIVPPDADVDNMPPIVGRIDYMFEDELGDNKFPRQRRKKTRADADTTDQLTTYDAAMQQKGIVMPALALKSFLPANSKETPDVQTVQRSPELMTPEARQNRIERTFYKFRTAWRGIQQGIFLPADNPMVCGRCPFWDRCQYSLVKSDYDALQIRRSAEDN